MGQPQLSVAERFWSKVGTPTADDCWPWTGLLTKDGYGVFSHGASSNAHRWAYTNAKGSIPVGLEIDHLCRVRNCVNPNHLEAVTHKENIHRGTVGYLSGWGATHCPHGHEYTQANTLYNMSPRGTRHRKCRVCYLATQARMRANRRAHLG